MLDPRTLKEIRRDFVLAALTHFGGNRIATAKHFKISVRALRNWLVEYRKDGRYVEPSVTELQQQEKQGEETSRP